MELQEPPDQLVIEKQFLEDVIVKSPVLFHEFQSCAVEAGSFLRIFIPVLSAGIVAS